MQVKIDFEGSIVTAHLSGEIDHHSALQIRERIDESIISRTPKRLIIDFNDVSFMDSSGIGLVMGRYRLLQGTDCKMAIINLSAHAYKVMQLAGMDRLAALRKKPKEVNSNESA